MHEDSPLFHLQHDTDKDICSHSWLWNCDTDQDRFHLGTHYEDSRVLCKQLAYIQRRVQPDQCYFTIQITDIDFECSL